MTGSDALQALGIAVVALVLLLTVVLVLQVLLFGRRR